MEYHWRKEDQSELVDVRDVGDLLGLTALMEANPYQVTATAVEDCLLFGLEWKKISALLDQFDDAKHYVRRHLFWATPTPPRNFSSSCMHGCAKNYNDHSSPPIYRF